MSYFNCFFSVISEEKGILTFLELAKKFSAKQHKIKFHIAGVYQNKKIQKKVTDLIENLQKNNIFIINHGPLIGANQKNLFFDSIDLFIFPSFYKFEAQPIVLLESLSNGIPTISTDIGDIKSIIDEEVGFTFSVNNFLEKSIEVINQLDSDRELLKKLSSNAVNKFNKLRKDSMSNLDKIKKSMLYV